MTGVEAISLLTKIRYIAAHLPLHALRLKVREDIPLKVDIDWGDGFTRF